MLKNKSLSFKIGVGCAIAHLLLFIYLILIIARIEVWGMVGPAIMSCVDIFLFPLIILVHMVFLLIGKLTGIWLPNLRDSLIYFVIYGFIGTLSWFFIPIGIAKIIKKCTRPKVKE